MNVIEILQNGGVGILPTDTIYGLVGKALDPDVVQRIRDLKGREENKPFIVLISEISDLGLFNIYPDKKTKEILSKVWPGPVSVELSASDSDFGYLTFGVGHFAFRLPADETLREMLVQTGPLVATSVNIIGGKP